MNVEELDSWTTSNDNELLRRIQSLENEMSIMYCQTCESHVDTQEEMMYDEDMCEGCAVEAELYDDDVYPEHLEVPDAKCKIHT